MEQLWNAPQEAFSLIGLMSTRLVMCMTVAPVLTPSQTPWVLRTGVAASISLPLVLPSLQHIDLASGSAYWVLALTMKEAVVGLMIGLLVGIPNWIAEGFGTLFDNERGAMTGGTFNPLIASPSPMGALLQYFAVLALLSSTSGHALFNALAWSFQYWKPADLLPGGPAFGVESIIAMFNGMTSAMTLYFLPMLALLMLLEFGLALMSVYAPSLQAFQMAMPVKSYSGLVMLLAALGLFWTSWEQRTWEHFTGLNILFNGKP